MSVRVELADLAGVLADIDRPAFVCTVGADGGPKVVHAFVVVDGDRLRSTVGRGTVANVKAGSAVTLVFAGSGTERSLLVDAAGTPGDGDDVITLTPTGAVWHRSAHEVGAP